MNTMITDNEVKQSMKDYMNQFEWAYGLKYNPTEKGLDSIMNTFKTNKANLISLFEKSPHYNGKYQIVLKDETYQRKIDTHEIHMLTYLLYSKLPETNNFDLHDKNIFVTCSLLNAYNYTNSYSLSKVVKMDMERGTMEIEVLISESSIALGEVYEVDILKFVTASPKEIVEKMKADNRVPYFFDPEIKERVDTYEYLQKLSEKETESFEEIRESYTNDLYYKAKECINLISTIQEQYISESDANKFNELFPELKVRDGQKTTRVVNKFCTKILELKKEKGSEFATRFSSYCDAMNPLVTPRWTILSIHPVDFLAMSNGYDWASCHTLNKMRDDGNYYNGCYSSGTLSYMCDGTSFVFYTVQREYDGDKFEFEPKMSRCMFHYGNDKLVQGRVYPQDNDGVNAVYKEIRPIVQRVIAEILDVPNLWRNVKGTGICNDMTIHTGTHFRDVLEFNNCNVSFYGSSDSNIEKNNDRILIGSYPICPRCGCVHETHNNILCPECREEMEGELNYER